MTPYALVDAIRAELTDDLLAPRYRAVTGRAPTTGHCYAASEATYHLVGGKAAGWTPMRIRHEGEPHWYLRGPDGRYLDPTEDQFTTPVPHASGIGCGFLTAAPSRRARILIERVEARVGATLHP